MTVYQQDLRRIAFDVYLDAARPGVGTMSFLGADGVVELEISIEASRPMTAASPGVQLTPGPVIPAGAWRRVELVAEEGDLRWRTRASGEPDTAPVAGSLGQNVLGPITQICLAATAPAGGAVSYDNLEIHGTNSGG